MNTLGTTRSLAVVLASFALVGCGMGAQSQNKPEEPGLYWYGKVGYECYSINCSGLLNANVGLPVDWSPRARCVGGGWNFTRAEIVSGALPPGLRIDPSSLHIVGVPKRAGTWHLRVRFVNVRCANMTYGSKTQDLHITTKGSSAPRRIP